MSSTKKETRKKTYEFCNRTLFIYTPLVFLALPGPSQTLGVCAACGLGWGRSNKPGIGVMGFNVSFYFDGFDVCFDFGFLNVIFDKVGFEVGFNKVCFMVGLALALPGLAPVGFDNVGLNAGFAVVLDVAETGTFVVGGPDEHLDVLLTLALTA
jgi:hypothetical protein